MLAIMRRSMSLPDEPANAKTRHGLLRTHQWLALCALLALVACLTLPQVTAGQESKSVVWADVDVTATLREDSSLHVTERDRIDFRGGPFRRGYREIPLARVEG